MRFRLTSFHNKSAFPATAHREARPIIDEFLESPGHQLSHGYPWKSHTSVNSGQKCDSVWLVFIRNQLFQLPHIVKTVNLAVWAISFNFLYDFTLFVIDMHQIMLISLFSTSFDHFHFHGFLKSKRMGLLKSCYNKKNHRIVKEGIKWKLLTQHNTILQ